MVVGVLKFLVLYVSNCILFYIKIEVIFKIIGCVVILKKVLLLSYKIKVGVKRFGGVKVL